MVVPSHAQVKGFLGEWYAVQAADVPDISQFSGWREFVASK
jgi:hypothetical protein